MCNVESEIRAREANSYDENVFVCEYIYIYCRGKARTFCKDIIRDSSKVCGFREVVCLFVSLEFDFRTVWFGGF